MTDGVRPVTPAGPEDRRSGDRRTTQRRDTRAVVVQGEPVDHPAEDAARTVRPGADVLPASAFAAQLIGQGGQRKGLKGGPPVLDSARSTYLEAEYSGEKDRRPPAGKTRATDV